MTNYYRNEIEDVLNSGPSGGDEYAFKVKVFGNKESKHLNITHAQLRSLADVMDNDAPVSLLPLANGHRAIHADVISRDGGKFAEGVVLVDLGEDHEFDRFVTWRVYLNRGECRWLASDGDYCNTIESGLHSFNRRRETLA